MTARLAVTWWGHSATTVEIGGSRIATDPVLVRRLAHLVRHTPMPTPVATDVDLVLVSHLHSDHLHVPSLQMMRPDATLVVPQGARHLLGNVPHKVIETAPGDRLESDGVTVDVLPARHDGRRHPLSRVEAPALGFRVEAAGRSAWYPGDTGVDVQMADVEAVDLALVPIGGWGPSLGAEHLDPAQAASAVRLVGARWAVPVHYGTFWPIGLRHIARANHHRLFVTPAERFVAALAGGGPEAVVPGHGVTVELGAS